TKRVSAMAVAPDGVSEILPVLDRAKAAGIPVIIFDTDVDWPSKLSFVGADNRRAGRLTGEHIVKLLSGRGKVAVIRGILGVRTHDDRLAGFREAIASSPGIQLVTVQPANSERAMIHEKPGSPQVHPGGRRNERYFVGERGNQVVHFPAEAF